MQPGGAAVGQAATRNHAQCSSTLAQQINLSIAHGPHHEPAEDNALGLEIQATEAAFFYSTVFYSCLDPGEPNDYTNDSCSHALG
jgi:hypothetical protein